ncbi:nitroreductase family protein [Leucobacter ruminantium]|uniref:Nitroreductase family protein n=1 Tax=Leucobacter ruminantium TaxID=1289170 RepID=A0A939LUD1_9MICO|nr:nitroreductase family protein [Leucobacter ruminantium]MBO1804970.1 nitroreductase family protein [Leucobacter ruminantium]
MTPRTAQTSAPVIEPLAERWSPRAFDTDHTFPEGALRGIMEAARWAPSANNTQPWRFIIARRGGESFAKVEDTLMGFNRTWAGAAAALIVNIAETTDAEGKDRPWAEYDLGQAVAHLSVQAHAEGFYTHQMGGFDREAIRTAFELDERLVPVSITAIGAIGDAEQLSETLRERETAPRTRLPLEDIVLVRD